MAVTLSRKLRDDRHKVATLAAMKHVAALFLALLLPSCANLTLDQRHALLTDATALASIAAGIYGGPGAAAGLNALGTVMQGFVGTVVPSKIVAASPGVGNLGANVVPLISTTAPVTQADVNAIFSAAKMASAQPAK